MSISLALLAGDVGYSQFLLEDRNKALLEVAGRSFLSCVLDSVARTSEFDAVYVIGPVPVLQATPRLAGRLPVIGIAQGHSVGANLRRVLDRAQPPTTAIVAVTCDAPLVSAEELDAFARVLRRTTNDIVVGISVQGDGFDARFTRAYQRSMIPLNDGPCLVENIVGVKLAGRHLLAECDRVFRLRKQTRFSTKIRTVGSFVALRPMRHLIGLWGRIVLAKWIWRASGRGPLAFRVAPSVREIDRALAVAFGGSLGVVSSTVVGACWDVDTPSQLELVREIIGEGACGVEGRERRHA